MTNQEKWIDFCAIHPEDICIYDKPFWLDAVCDGRENWDVFLAEEKDEIIAALPYYKKKWMGLKYISMPKVTQHNGIWLKKVENEKTEKRISREYRVYRMLIDQIEASGYSVYQQSFSPEVENWQPFYWMGYKQKTLYTFCIDSTSDIAEVELRFSKATRSNIRKAQQSGTIGELDDLALFYKINCMAFAKTKGGNPVSFALLERLYKACRENDAIKMLYAKDPDGNVCNAALFVYDASSVYALLAGTDPDKRKYNYSSVLTYEGIKFACETGRTFDFEGSMLEGVATHCTRFGAEMHPYYSIKKVFVKTPLLRQYLKLKQCK